MIKSPIIVTGIWHSGTRIIAKLLNENDYIFRNHTRNYDADIIWNDYLQDIILKQYPFDNDTYENIDIIRDKIIGIHGSEFDWGIKLPGIVMCLPYMFRVFPNAKFIYIVRHGIDVSLSHVRTYRNQEFINLSLNLRKYNTYLSPTKLKSFDEHKLLALRWNRLIDLFIQDNKSISNILIVKFEDVILNTDKCLKMIAKFLNKDKLKLSFILDKTKVFKYKHYKKYGLTKEQIIELYTLCETGLYKMNYTIEGIIDNVAY